MLKKIRLVTLILVAIIWFIIILPYFLVQTDIGTRYASQLISYYNKDYSIRIGHISHSITKPYEITLDNVSIEDKTHLVTYLSAKKAVIGLKQTDLLQAKSFDYLVLENGDIKLSPSIENINIDFLQLKDISLYYQAPNKANNIVLNHIYGGIKPWSKRVITERIDSQFNFTIEMASYNDIDIQSIFVKGNQKDKTLQLINLGGDIKTGFFTANASVLADNSVLVKQLKVNKLNFQSEDGLSNINKMFSQLPKTDIQQLSIIDSSINLADFSVEKANLDIQNITYNHDWQLQKSNLFFNAQSMTYHEQLIEQPLVQWRNQENKIIIEQALGLWNKGSIKLSANWQNNELTIDSIIASGIRYQLPLNWWQQLAKVHFSPSLPSHITIKQFTLMPSLIIDTNPEFPFQFTNFEAFGNNIDINSTNEALHVNGTILFKADSGTLNTIELQKPDLSLNFTPTENKLSFSTLISQGVLEGDANLISAEELQSLSISSHAVDSQILSLWYLINNPIKTDNFDIKLHGYLEPLSLDGILQTADKQYQIKNNQLDAY
ncbi:hypothetical protein RHO13_08890 [Orbus wheelerorum]|uniref:hypothetical protein n=1 Tax=Orbus wheelerorum TaxID=3074111 RepID=UPI00370DB504